MSKITVTGICEPVEIRVCDIPVGTAFTGSISYPSLFLRTFSCVVDLKDPQLTWEHSNPSVVKDFREVNLRIVVD